MSSNESGSGAQVLPNLVIAGVTKAGTTSLFHYLGQHPAVGTSDVKELRYFSPLRYGEPLGPLETYTRHFSSCVGKSVVTEATPGYFFGGGRVARVIRTTCPNVKVLVSLRSPADRCWSWFRFVKSRVRIPKDMTFSAYLDRCEELHRARVDDHVENQPYWGLGGGCYANWMDDWIGEFGADLKIVFFEDLRRDPRAVMTSICEWLELDIDPVDRVSFSVENETQQYRNKQLQRAAVLVNRHSERFFRRHVSAKRALRRAYYHVNRSHRDRSMPMADRLRLDDFYEPYNLRLDAQLAQLSLALPDSWRTRGDEAASSGRA